VIQHMEELDPRHSCPRRRFSRHWKPLVKNCPEEAVTGKADLPLAAQIDFPVETRPRRRTGP